ARSHHVAGSQARAAYAKAPYRSAPLRYLYTVGWVSSASNLTSCKAAQILGPDPVAAAAQALRGSPKTLALLRRAHVTGGEAAAAIGRGATDGCGQGRRGGARPPAGGPRTPPHRAPSAR